MGRARNPHTIVNFGGLNADTSIARLLGINPDDAMVLAYRPDTELQECEQMTHLLIAKDESTYDRLMLRARDLGVPVPEAVIAESQAHNAARRRSMPHGEIYDEGVVPNGFPGSFSACCAANKNVTVVFLGEVPAEEVNYGEQSERSLVLRKMAVLAVSPHVAGLEPAQLPITKVSITPEDNFNPCE